METEKAEPQERLYSHCMLEEVSCTNLLLLTCLQYLEQDDLTVDALQQ